MAIRLHGMKLPKGILPGALYNPDTMLKCLEWIKEKSKDKNCLGVLCAHEYM